MGWWEDFQRNIDLTRYAREGSANLGQVFPNLTAGLPQTGYNLGAGVGNTVQYGLSGAGAGLGAGLQYTGAGLGAGLQQALSGTGTGLGSGLFQLGKGGFLPILVVIGGIVVLLWVSSSTGTTRSAERVLVTRSVPA